MQTFHIEVRETLSKIIEVEAESSAAAIDHVQDRYYNRTNIPQDTIVLTADDFDGSVEFYDQTEDFQDPADSLLALLTPSPSPSPTA